MARRIVWHNTVNQLFLAADLAIDSIESFHIMSLENLRPRHSELLFKKSASAMLTEGKNCSLWLKDSSGIFEVLEFICASLFLKSAFICFWTLLMEIRHNYFSYQVDLIIEMWCTLIHVYIYIYTFPSTHIFSHTYV